MKICIALRTRPETIKTSPVIRARRYSFNLGRVFFDQLALPCPKYNLGTCSGTQAEKAKKGRLLNRDLTTSYWMLSHQVVA